MPFCNIISFIINGSFPYFVGSCMLSSPIPEGRGLCAFVSRDIERGEVIVEYEGEVISLEEAGEREKRYQRERKSCTMMVLESAGNQIA